MLLLLLLLAVAGATVLSPTPLRSPVAERLQFNVTCDLCKLFAGLFDEGLRLNWTESVFLSAAADLCADVSALALCCAYSHPGHVAAPGGSL